MGRTPGHTALASHGRPSPPCVLCPCSDLKLRVRILIDGTLIIFRVKPEDAGKYTCVPSNSLGRSPSASAYLTVQCEWAHWPCWGREGGLGEGGQRRGQGEGGGQPWRKPYQGWLVQVNGARSGSFSRPCGCPCPLIHPASLTLAGLRARMAFRTLSSCWCWPAPLFAPGMRCFFSLSEGVWLTPGGATVLPALCSPAVLIRGTGPLPVAHPFLPAPGPSGPSLCSSWGCPRPTAAEGVCAASFSLLVVVGRGSVMRARPSLLIGRWLCHSGNMVPS